MAPDASNTCGAAETATGFKTRVKPKLAIVSKSQCLALGANVGIVPRRLVIELVIDCMDFIVLVDVEVCFRSRLSGACFSSRSYLFKAEILTGTRHNCGVFSKPARAVLYQSPKPC